MDITGLDEPMVCLSIRELYLLIRFYRSMGLSRVLTFWLNLHWDQLGIRQRFTWVHLYPERRTTQKPARLASLLTTTYKSTSCDTEPLVHSLTPLKATRANMPIGQSNKRTLLFEFPVKSPFLTFILTVTRQEPH